MRFDVPDGWITEHAAVLTIELAHALIAHLVSCRSCVNILQKHPFACSLQPQLLLVLQRCHGGQLAEVTVKCRNPHACKVGKLMHAQRLMKIVSEPGDRLCGSVAQIAHCGNGPESFALPAA